MDRTRLRNVSGSDNVGFVSNNTYMCAINPAHKKRLILDVYTSLHKISAKEFETYVLEVSLQLEQNLNEESSLLRWHIKETDQNAD